MIEVAYLVYKSRSERASDKKDKGGYYILIKEAIHQGDVIDINTYTPNNRNPKYMKQN